MCAVSRETQIPLHIVFAGNQGMTYPETNAGTGRGDSLSPMKDRAGDQSRLLKGGPDEKDAAAEDRQRQIGKFSQDTEEF